MGKELRNEKMLRLHSEGKGATELAQRFGVSKRTVYRIIGRNHEQ
jgi:Mor family transcriptional regulator